jgi:hypothetical protein
MEKVGLSVLGGGQGIFCLLFLERLAVNPVSESLRENQLQDSQKVMGAAPPFGVDSYPVPIKAPRFRSTLPTRTCDCVTHTAEARKKKPLIGTKAPYAVPGSYPPLSFVVCDLYQLRFN